MGKTGALILAAGESSRLGHPKQLIQFRGKSLLHRIVDAAKKARCSPTVVVIGSDREEVERELKAGGAIIVENENWRLGIGTSIRAGVRRLIDKAPTLEAVVLLVCDQPFVDARTIARLITLREKTKRAIVASRYANTLGVPALFDRSCFQELAALDNATGAKTVILSNRERVAEFPFPEGRIDIDTLDDYEKLLSASSSAKKFTK
jgi:molybdenum cofactor cytidylyltransferase